MAQENSLKVMGIFRGKRLLKSVLENYSSWTILVYHFTRNQKATYEEIIITLGSRGDSGEGAI